MHDDGTNHYCYFLYNTELASDKMTDGEQLCGKYDADAHLAVIDTEAKKNHLASLGIFSAVSVYVKYIYIASASSSLINTHVMTIVICTK